MATKLTALYLPNKATIIDMLPPDGDLDELCALRRVMRFLNKLDIPYAKSKTIIVREPHNGKRYPVYHHTESNLI